MEIESRSPQRPWARRLRRLLGLAALPLLAGVLVVLSFPPFGGGILLFPALALFLRSLRGQTRRGAFLRGYLFGLVLEGGGFYWIAGTMARFGELDPEWLGWLGFALWWLLTALFWGLWGLLLTVGGGTSGPDGGSAARIPGWRWLWPALSLIALEAVFPRVFRWNLGAGLVGWTAFLQPAAWFGVAALSGGVVLVAQLLAAAWSGGRQQGRPAALTAVGVVALWGGSGALRLASGGDGESELRIGYVQACIPLEVHASDPRRALDLLIDGSRQLLERRSCDLLVWSEGILPAAFHTGARVSDLFQRLALGPPVLAGGRGRVQTEVGEQWSNRAYLWRPPAADGKASPVELYDKRFLLSFGERFPLRAPLAAIGVEIPFQDQYAGESVLVSEIAGVPIGVSICYEGIVAATGRDLRAAGARVHINLTEDLWYGDTSAPRQHLGLAVAQTVAAGVPLVRVTNSGISAYVDRFGRVRGRQPLATRAADVFTVSVPAAVGAAPWTQSAAAALPWLTPLLLLAHLLLRRREPANP